MRDLFTQPPTREQLGEISKTTPGGVREMMTTRTEFPEYQQNIAGKTLTDDQLLDLLARIPNLLRKPMLVAGGRALQGTDDPARIKAFVESL